VAEVTGQLNAEIARRGRLSAEASDQERELRARLAELERAGQKAAADLDARARASAADAAAKDQQIAALEQARRDAAAQIATLTEQAAVLRENARPQAPAAPAPAAAVAPEREPEKPPLLAAGQLVVAIKTELSRLGCYSAPIDANWQTPALHKSLADFAARTHLAKIPDAPAPQLLDDLRSRGGRICVPDCGPRETESDGRCVPKTCAVNLVLDRHGTCVPRNEPKPPEHKPPEHKPPGRAGCFTFNGKQFCE
jgi:hypothetical protein